MYPKIKSKNIEFKNQGKFSDINTKLSQNITIKLLISQGILTKTHIKIIERFLKDLKKLVLSIEENSLLKIATITTLEEKLGNSFGAISYSAFLDAKDNGSLTKLVYALLSLQLLADIGDTVSDAMEVDGNNDLKKLVKDIYDLEVDFEPITKFLKDNIKVLFENIDSEIKDFFLNRWSEFIIYEQATISQKSSDYLKKIFDIYEEIKNKRKVFGLQDIESFWKLGIIEYVASKGGTTSLLGMLRSFSLNKKFSIKEYDIENTYFDYLNFSSDHVVDIATDNGFIDIDEMKLNIEKPNNEEFNMHFNAVHLSILRDLNIKELNNQNIDEYLNYLKKYYYRLLDLVYTEVNVSKGINFKLFKPMVLYFFKDAQPSEAFSKDVIQYVINL